MLGILTFSTDLIAMIATLWMAFYLFARGFPNRITMRAVLSLLALSTFFLGAYNNFFTQLPGTAAWRAVVLMIGLGCWYSLTFQLLSEEIQTKFRWMEIGIYLFCFVTVVILAFSKNSFIGEYGNNLYVAHMRGGFPYTLYGSAQILVSLVLLFNLLIEPRIRSTVQGKFFLLASAFPVLTVIYGVVALIIPNPPMPRLIQDVLIFCGIFLLGISVARHQSLIERRSFFRDFPTTGLIVLVLVSAYICIALVVGVPIRLLGIVAAFFIITHSLYDIGQEVLGRLRTRDESRFRRQLSLIAKENPSEEKIQVYFKKGLDKLCEILNTSAGVIAVRRGEYFIVVATRNSVQLESKIPLEATEYTDLFRSGGYIHNIDWMASAFEGPSQIVLVGIGPSNIKLDYSSGDLDLLAEFTDQAGTVASIANLQPRTEEDIRQMLDESQARAMEIESAADGMILNLSITPEEGYIKMVEEGLRKFQDFVALGQSSLAGQFGAQADSQIDRGKQIQKLLRDAIDALRPSGTRPVDPLPRAWYHYAVLHDAYVEGAPNRDVMARLYISEGTFNRTRRTALRGVTRWLMEKSAQI